MYGVDPYDGREGGSIPVCALFQESPNPYTVSFAVGLRDAQVHAPDAFFRIESVRRGPLAYGRSLHHLGSVSLS